MPNAVDITGQRFGRLTALAYAGHLRSGSQPKRAYRFRCDCGKEVVRTVMDVRRLDTMSCGCLKRDNMLRKPAHNRLGAGESSFRSLHDMYVQRAKQLDVPFSLTVTEFRALAQGCCAYCGAYPSQVRRANRSSHGTFIYNGLDRVDNARGYTSDNAVSACGFCNRAKNNVGVEEFKSWVKRVADNLGL